MSYPSLYDEAYRYYGSQHPLNPAQLLDSSYGNIPPHAPTFSDEPKLSGMWVLLLLLQTVLLTYLQNYALCCALQNCFIFDKAYEDSLPALFL